MKLWVTLGITGYSVWSKPPTLCKCSHCTNDGENGGSWVDGEEIAGNLCEKMFEKCFPNLKIDSDYEKPICVTLSAEIVDGAEGIRKPRRRTGSSQ